MAQNRTDAFGAMRNLYPVSKTVAFRGIPIAETLKYMTERKIMQKGNTLSENRKLVKQAGDRYIKDFINMSLMHASLKIHSDGSKDSIEELNALLKEKPSKKGDNDERRSKEKEIQAIATKLKNQLAASFKDTAFLKKLGSEAFFKEVLAGADLNEKEAKALEAIKKNTTYMADYQKRRLSLFDPKFTGYSIMTRSIDDNLPIHLRNCEVFRKVAPIIREDLAPIFEEVRPNIFAESLDEVFTPAMFNVLLAQCDIETYNTIIGGKTLSERKMIHGVNACIERYNKTAAQDQKLPSMKKLKKQILSDREPVSWLPEEFKNDNEVVEAVDMLIKNFHMLCKDTPVEAAVREPDTDGIFVNAKNLNSFSNIAYGRFFLAKNAVIDELKHQFPKRPRKSIEKYEKEIEAKFKKQDHFSVAFLDRCIAAYNPTLGRSSADAFGDIVKNKADVETKIADYLQERGTEEVEKIDEALKQKIRLLLNEMMKFHHSVERFLLKDMPTAYDVTFYELVEENEANAESLIKTFNMIRNRMTKKPYNTSKVRLYFDNPTLGAGWAVTKEYTNRILLFKDMEKDEEKIYFGIVPTECKNLTRNSKGELKEDILAGNGKQLEKVEITIIPDAAKMLSAMFFSANWARTGSIKASDYVLEIHDKVKASGSAKDLSPEEKVAMIDYYKKCIATVEHWKRFNLKYRPSDEYESVKEFCDSVTEQAVNVSSRPVSEEKVFAAVARGDLYLFQLDNQDMHKKHHGTVGNPTVWLREAISCDPAAAVRLCGNVAVYYRKASLNRKVTHPAGVPMENKNPDNPRKTRTLTYDLIKDKRYTEDNFSFHIPLEVNFRADSRNNKSIVINDLVNRAVKANPDMPVLGINRGERHLIAYAVTASDGKILEQGNFNVINGYNYRELLASRERERSTNKQNWENIKDIANLKDGYLSLVIGEIARLVQKYNCVVAIENLDDDFINTRQKFERNVYSRFETALEQKFTLLTDKTTSRRSSESLQLAATNKSGSFEVQNGILFRTMPWMISRTDPSTGFISFLKLFHKNNESSQKYLSSFDSFRYNQKEDLFELSFDYKALGVDLQAGERTKWTVCTYGERTECHLDKEHMKLMVTDVHDLTKEMKTLLDKQGIKYASGKDILKDVAEAKNGGFYRDFFTIISRTVCGSSWYEDKKEYRFIGCTRDSEGRFYDTRTCRPDQPCDVDTLAAWNLSRRVHRILDNIRSFDPENPPLDEDGKKLKSPKKGLSRAEWLKIAQK